MATIAFFEVNEHAQEYFQKKLARHALLFFEERLSRANVARASQADILSIGVYSEISAPILARLPHLRLLITRSTGYDHVDLAACRAHRVTVTNVPKYGEHTVAEHTFALILALSRRLPEAFERTRRGEFSIEGLEGFELAAKTLGVIGTGTIGLQVIRIAKGFGMKILAFSRTKKEEEAQRLGFRYTTLEDLLRNSDIVSLHCPLTAETRHLINWQRLEKMKRGSLLINTARGAIIDTADLIRALEAGILGGVGLDVLEEETMVKEEMALLARDFPKEQLRTILENHLLLRFPNVVITPHNAWYSREAVSEILETTVANIRAFLSGRPLNRVTD